MNKMVDLENDLFQTLDGYNNLESIGFSELDEVIAKIDGFKNEAYEFAVEVLSGLSRGEDGKFISKGNMDLDIHEIALVSSAVDTFTEKVYSEIHRLHVERTRKSDLFFQKGRRVNELRANKRINLAQIAKCEAEIKECDFSLSGELVKGNEALRQMYEAKKELNLSLIESFKSANDLANIEIEKLTLEMETLKNGGVLDFGLEPSIDDLNKKTLENENIVENNEELNHVDEINPDFISPILNNDEENEELGDDNLELPEEPVDNENLNADGDDLGLVNPILPDDILPEEPTDDENLDLPEENIEDGDLTLPVEPTDDELDLPEEPVDTEDLELPEEPANSEENENIPVISCTTPKQSLFKKIALIIGAAIAALGSIASMAHLALHISEHSDEATEEESQITEDEKEEVPNETPEQTPEETPSVTPEETPGGDGGTSNEEEKPEDTPSEEEKPEDTPVIPEDTPSPLPNDNTVFPVEIGEGEVIFNEETGVEVTYDGSAYLHEEDGNVQTQEDRDLIETDHDTSVVVGEDLLPDEGPTVEEQLESIPQTGEEQTYEEALPELTEGEKENLDQAFADWEAYFSDAFTDGTSMTP